MRPNSPLRSLEILPTGYYIRKMVGNLKKKPLGGLPSGVGVCKVFIKKVPYWRVRLGKRFTGGRIEIKHFSDLSTAKAWIYGDDANANKPPKAAINLGILNLKKKFGTSAFALSYQQLVEARTLLSVYRQTPHSLRLSTIGWNVETLLAACELSQRSLGNF